MPLLLSTMPPNPIFKTLKAKVTASLSDLFVGKNTSGSQDTDYNSSSVTSATRSIAVLRESSEATKIRSRTARGGSFNHAHDFTVMNPTMVDQSTNISYQIASDREVKAKELLLQHIIAGAAHNSSARDPPPRCHPGTRIKINERIMAWFYDENKKQLILWIYGPAGVGKSAIVQTIAEALALAKCLGASVFFSRPNGRNSSRSVFITIAYQLAVHINAYCTFISEKLAADPELVDKGMEEQFRAFIVEPFVEKQIGAGGQTWGILLDGLDELDDRHWQREIIRLITAFSLEHPGIPLAWVIASRPEPHILDTFKGPRTVSSYWEEHVPVDSPEAWQDVERYLRCSFEAICRDFPRIVPSNWPDEEQITKLAHSASGLFAFAEVVVRFIGNPNHADPVTRLDHILSAINRSVVNPANNRPFAPLDALYMYILSSISPEMWPITRRVLSAIMVLSGDVCCVKGISVLLDLEPSKIYTSINDLYSVLKIPDDVYSQLSFYHTSFVDLLLEDPPSREFSTFSADVIPELRRDFDQCSLRVWRDFRRRSPRGPSAEYEDRWTRYASRFHSDTNPPANVLGAFNNSLFSHIRNKLLDSLQEQWDLARNEGFQCHWDQFLDLLSQVDVATACRGRLKPCDFINLLFDAWKTYQDRLSNAGIVCEIKLEELQLDHLEWPKEIPMHMVETPEIQGEPQLWIGPQCSSYQEFNVHISALKHIRQHNPKVQVLICGTLGNRFAAFIYKYVKSDFEQFPFHVIVNFDKGDYRGFYFIPYVDNV